MKMKRNTDLHSRKGFTLLEVLLVVAAISILAGIVILALNPSKQLGDTRNAARRSDVATILNAFYQYAIDNNGNFPSGLDSDDSDSQVLGDASTGCSSTCTATTTVSSCLDVYNDLVPDYLVDIPFDPTTGDADNTDYYINKLDNGRLVVGSCDPEQSAEIEIKR